MGSKTRKVRFPNNADTRITINKPYLIFLKSWGGSELFFRLEKLNRSNNVPNGHNHPHQARPINRLDSKMIKEIDDQAKKTLLLNKLEIIANGLNRIGISINSGGNPSSARLKITPMKKTANERPWVIFRASTQRCPLVNGLFFLCVAFSDIGLDLLNL